MDRVWFCNEIVRPSCDNLSLFDIDCLYGRPIRYVIILNFDYSSAGLDKFKGDIHTQRVALCDCQLRYCSCITDDCKGLWDTEYITKVSISDIIYQDVIFLFLL